MIITNQKGFSILSILIVIGLIILGYLIYDDFIKKNNLIDNETLVNKNLEEIASSSDSVRDNKIVNEIENKKVEPIINNQVKVQEKEVEKPVDNLPVNSIQPGYYKNSKYNYEIKYPDVWPLKIRSEENISIGTVPPKNGQGAITIEIGGDTSSEIDQLKKEASKYPGLISIKESSVVLSNTSGTKIIITNNIANKKDVYLLIDKYNVNYIIKYSYESDSFVKQVEESIQTFKFFE